MFMTSSSLTTTLTDEAAPVDLWWVGPLIGILTVLIGSGGIVAYRRLRLDKQLGVAAADLAEDAAISARWERIIEAQTKSLIEPLRIRLAEVTAELASQSATIERNQQEITSARKKYWRAIAYIRILLAWSRARGAADEPPPAPPEIADDL